MTTENLKLTPAQQEAYKAHRAALVEQCTLLGQMKEKAGADAAFASELQLLVDNANAQLSKLPPLEQVPAAMELSHAVNWFMSAWENASEYAKSIFGRLQDMAAKLQASAAEVNAFKGKITSGDLVEKAKHIELCDTAKTEAGNAVRTELMPEIIASRKATIEANKWPMPADELLSKPASEFNAAIEIVKANIAAAKSKKIELNGRGDKALRMNLWKQAAEFNAAIEQVESMLGDTKPNKGKINPGLGGDRQEKNSEEEVKPKRHGLFSMAPAPEPTE